MRKKSKKAKTRELDILFAQAVKKRDGFRCRWCGKSQNVQIHHIYSRLNRSVRWDFENAVTLCVACHFRAHHEPVEFFRFIEKEVDIEKLSKKAKEVFKVGNEEYQKLKTLLGGQK